MKFSCEKSVLSKEIGIAGEVIASKNAISILSNIYLEAKDSSLTIKATDLKVTFETKVPVTVEEEGSTTVFGDKFMGILNNLPEGEMEFEQKDMAITIKSKSLKGNYHLKSIASEKFPEFPQDDTAQFFDLPIKDFKEMIQQTVFAVSFDETRYFMNGVFCEKEDGGLVMVGTDGRRLAYIKKNIGAAIPDFKGAIIPTKVLGIAGKRAGDEGLISLAITDNIFYLKFASYYFSSVLIEGQFPNYRRVIPENQLNHFIVKRTDMLEAVRRVSLLLEAKETRIKFSISSGTLVVDSEESDLGDAKMEIPCQYEGEGISLALNYHYIEEPFKAMAEEDIEILFNEPTKAITVRPMPEKDFFHIVMPMQID
ncbi:MAG: DNA polymerase III subunit beta [Spirochaetaceae bacterium]|jgi:DNA polymerase-3 subunit beta|nr:DNA polymerase III subunit beta [Spirochaetaceae bacterium]